MGEGVTAILTSGGCWGHPPTNHDPKAEGGIKPALPNGTNKAIGFPPRTPTPPQPSPSTQALVFVQPPTLPHGFSGVMACLHTPELVEVDLKAPVGAMAIGLISTPGT